MYIYINTHVYILDIYTYICIYMHMYECMYAHTYVYIYMYICIYRRVYIYIYIFIYICIYIYTYVCIYTQIYIYIARLIHIYIYIYVHVACFVTDIRPPRRTEQRVDERELMYCRQVHGRRRWRQQRPYWALVTSTGGRSSQFCGCDRRNTACKRHARPPCTLSPRQGDKRS